MDLTSGSGSDSIAVLINLDPKQIFCVDYMPEEDFVVELKNMQKKKYVDAFGDIYSPMKIMRNGDGPEIWNQQISMHKQQASDFITRCAKYFKTRPTYMDDEILGYFDPSWDAKYLLGLSDDEYQEALKETGGNVEFEVSPKILIQKHILGPMIEGGIEFSVFCVKVRWEMTSVKMQEYLNLNPEVVQHFVVLYSVQALPFVKSSELVEENGRLYITDKQGKKKVRRKGQPHGSVKSQFHWIIMKNIKYAYLKDRRSWWYKKWIEHSNTPVYVETGSQVKPHKPLYENALPYPNVIDQDEYNQLKAKSAYKQMGPQTPLSTVQENDIEYFVKELETLMVEWRSSTDKKDLIGKVVSLVEGCENYMDTLWCTSKQAVHLRELVRDITILIKKNELGVPDVLSTAGLESTHTVDLRQLIQQLKLAIENY